MKPFAASPELPAAHRNFRSSPHRPSYNTTGTTAAASAPLPVKECPYTERIESPRPAHRKKTRTAAETTAPFPPELLACCVDRSIATRRVSSLPHHRRPELPAVHQNFRLPTCL